MYKLYDSVVCFDQNKSAFESISNPKKIHEEVAEISDIMETNLKKSGILENGVVRDFTTILKYREEFSEMEFFLNVSDTHMRILQPISSTTVCDEMIDGYFILSKSLYNYDEGYVFIQYETIDGYYLIQGKFEGDKPNGMCIEKYFRTSRNNNLYSERYGNFADGVRQGEFILTYDKCNRMVGFLICENYLNGVLKGKQITLKFSGGGMIKYCEFSERTYSDNTSPIVGFDENVAYLSMNTKLCDIKYYFLYKECSFLIKKICKHKCDIFRKESFSHTFEDHKIISIHKINDKIIIRDEILDKKNDFIRLHQHDLYFHFSN